MDTPQRVLVAESARLIREESWSLSRKIVREMVEVDRVTERSLLLILFRAATILKGSPGVGDRAVTSSDRGGAIVGER